MTLDQVVEKFRKHPHYIKSGAGKMSKRFKCSKETIYEARRIVRSEESSNNTNNILNSKEIGKRILVIGDSHIPYEKEGYLEFCKQQYDQFNCDTVIHIGDLIDSHSTSRHPSVPEAYSPGNELLYTIHKLRDWYNTFPNMKVVIGNHDARVNRIASEAKIAAKWLKDYNQVLEVPNWEFSEYYETNELLFTHGTGTSGMGAAYKRALNVGKNVIIGHLHSESSIIYHKLPNTTIFGMIVGCGVDEHSYGMNYAKNAPKKSIISCGLILEGQPLIRVMNE